MLQADRHIQRPVSPPWKVRSRPCPFYSSGRCLFSDSCNFRHVIKSPLTPIERPLSFQYHKGKYIEPYNVLDDGEYDDSDATLNWSKGLPGVGSHSREPSAASYTDTISSTETGTVRGYPHVGQDEFNDDTLVNDEPDLTVYGLGLTNLHEVRRDYSQDFGLASQGPTSTLRAGCRPTPLHVANDSPSTPFVFPLRIPNLQQHRRSSSYASSYAQEVEVASHRHSEISLETPNASSLLINRRKATVSEWSAQVDSREPPQFDAPGSPTITLKSLGRNTRPVDENGILVALPSPSPSPSPQLLETPSMDCDLESPSRARQRFHNAFKLVTNELKMRQRLLRKSPITPDPPSTSADNGTSLFSQKRESIRYIATDSSEKDSRHGGLTTAGSSFDTQEQQDNGAGPRSWLKPFRLSTLGSPALPLTPSQTNPPAPSSRRPSEDSKPTTRPTTPSKRSVTPASSRKAPLLENKSSYEEFSFIPALESPFANGNASPPVPASFISPVNSRPATSRSGSVHYIHSPSPTKWAPPFTDSTPRKGSYTASPHSVSPIRAKKMSPRSHSSHSSKVVISTPPPLPTTQPKLFFAIASNQPDEVAKLLANGSASPNETVGPQDMHALAFAVENATNGDPANMPQLQEIVTTLLSYGAELSPEDRLQAHVDPLLSHFLDKADRSPIPKVSPSNTADLEIPLKRAKFTVVGQENGLMEFARAYAAHIRLAQYLSEEGDGELPFVALLAGPSGHGKTLLASKVGSLLSAPSYTVNLTLVKGQRDLWSSASCNKKEAVTHRTLVEFLTANNGRPAVVILDEIEKLENLSLLQSLLVPWETGRLQADGTSGDFIDASQTIWLCTSNIASQEVIQMAQQDTPPSFDAMVKQTRSCLRDALGASLVARVSTIIPFLPFSWEERLAISSKCLTALQRNVALSDPSALANLPPDSWKGVIESAAGDYLEAEGARSIRRSILRSADAVLHGVSI